MSKSRFFPIALIWLGLMLAPACGRRFAPRPPNVVLVVVDALRADHLGFMGYGRDTTPFLDSLSREGVVFKSAYSQSSYTKTSMASLLTGLNPDTVGVCEAEDVLPAGAQTLAEMLKAAGYRTGGVQANPGLDAKFGFGQGFDWYVELFPDDLMQKQEKVGYRAERINQLALEWLQKQDSKQPWFLYLHYMETHSPYLPPAPEDRRYDPEFDRTLPDFTLVFRFLYGPERVPMPAALEQTYRSRYAPEQLLHHVIALYDGELHYFDGQFKRFMQQLTASGRGRNTLVIVAADHGEEFRDHGRLEHGKSLYQEVTSVPLLFYFPERIPKGMVRLDLVRNLDIVPTVLDLAGVPLPASLAGQSLRPRWEKKPGAAPPYSFARLYASGQTDRGGAVWGDGVFRDYASITSAQWRLVRDLKTSDNQLFQRQTDPGDRSNLAGARPDQVQALADELNRRLRESAAAKQTLGLTQSEKTLLDPEMKKKLESLGYLHH
jgi:arylsulfatase A-like enzyme